MNISGLVYMHILSKYMKNNYKKYTKSWLPEKGNDATPSNSTFTLKCGWTSARRIIRNRGIWCKGIYGVAVYIHLYTDASKDPKQVMWFCIHNTKVKSE